MFGRRRPHKGELPISPGALGPDAWELARFWIDGGRSFVVTSFYKQHSPELIGSLLLESARTAATGYAQHAGISEDEAWALLLNGMDEERQRLSRSGDEHGHE